MRVVLDTPEVKMTVEVIVEMVVVVVEEEEDVLDDDDDVVDVGEVDVPVNVGEPDGPVVEPVEVPTGPLDIEEELDEIRD